MSSNLKFAKALAAIALAVCTISAHADIQFSGVGAGGNLISGAESWSISVLPVGDASIWSSSFNYGRAEAAYGMDITFEGAGGFLPGFVTMGNTLACGPSHIGSTTFCTVPPPNHIWIGTVVDANSISFRAQEEDFLLSPGGHYDVRVFFSGAPPTSFTGRWLTEFSPEVLGSVPEPGTLAMLVSGLAVMTLIRRRA